MYRVLFIFDYRDHHWRMLEAMKDLLLRKPQLRSLNPATLERLWVRHHLDRFHFILFYPEPMDDLVAEVDQEFLEDPLLVHFMYRMFYSALTPNTHECFHSVARVRTDGTRVILEYSVEGQPPPKDQQSCISFSPPRK